jgi:hypothetical protein
MKTKTLLFITCLALFCPDLRAGNPRAITSREAIIVANHQLNKLGMATEFKLKESEEIMEDELLLAYAFNLTPAGYIVVTASTGLPPVIAYSFEGNYGEMSLENPLYELLKSDLSDRIAYCNTPDNFYKSRNESLWETILKDDSTSGVRPLFEQWPATGDGWLKTNWTQNPPYNNFCRWIR